MSDDVRTFTSASGPAPTSGLGPLEHLRGCWQSKGFGWNLIALPFETAPQPAGFNYRVLMNQYNENLKFGFVDDNVPNRGLPITPPPLGQAPFPVADQQIATLDYLQLIVQVAASDFPNSGKAGGSCTAIHHEPGLFLHMKNRATADHNVPSDSGLINIARLGNIPHGNTVLALGGSKVIDGPPTIPELSALPLGVTGNIDHSEYLLPYRHFVQNPFKGIVGQPGFPGFHPIDANALLRLANEQGQAITKTTELTFDTSFNRGGVLNIPFIHAQANAASVRSTFWIMELEGHTAADPKLRLQYSQVVMLDFFGRRDGLPGLIQWPHVSINTLEKVAENVCDDEDMVAVCKRDPSIG